MSDLRKASQQALEVLKTSGCVAFTGSACYCNSTCSSYTAAVILRDALAQEQVEPALSRQMADAGFQTRDNRLTCDECGGKFTRQMLPIHKCAQQAEPVQEPVAWMWEETARRSSTGIGGIDRKLLFCRPADEPWKRNITPLYTAPPQRPPLTDAEIAEIYLEWDAAPGRSMADFARAIEKKVRGEE